MLGDRMRDVVTGAEGVAMARDEWLNGCIRLGLQRPLKKDGSVPELYWVDEAQCELLKSAAFVPERRQVEVNPAGPQADPPAPMAR